MPPYDIKFEPMHNWSCVSIFVELHPSDFERVTCEIFAKNGDKLGSKSEYISFWLVVIAVYISKIAIACHPMFLAW